MTGWNGLQPKPVAGIERKASLPGSDMRSDMVTTPSGLQYSVVDWLNGLNSGPFDGFFDTTETTLKELSRMLPECNLTDDSYNEILDEFCVMTFGQRKCSFNVSDVIIVAMNRTDVMTAFDQVLWMICCLTEDLQVTGYGPNDIPWRYTESEKWRTQERWSSRPDAELLWERKTELVCREEFQSRIRAHGLPGGAALWSDTAIEELLNRVAVEACHLKKYLRPLPLAQAVALLSHQVIPGEAASCGESLPAPEAPLLPAVSPPDQSAHFDRLRGGDEDRSPAKQPAPQDIFQESVSQALQKLDDPKGRDRSILIAMHELNATPKGSRVNAENIARRAIDRTAGAESIKALMVRLRRMELADSKKGRSGGSKLTPLGEAVALELKRDGMVVPIRH